MIFGRLRLVERCADSCSRSWFVESDTGELSEVVAPADCPLNTRAAFEIAGGRIESWELAEPEFESGQSNELRICIVRPVYAESEKTAAEAWLAEACDRLRDQLLTSSQGRWRVDVRGIAVVDNEQARGLFAFGYGPHRAEIAETWPNWEPTHWIGRGGHKAGINGEAIVGSNRARIYGSGNWRTLIHEFGHCLGRGHANLPGQEYGDMSSLMGKGTSGWHVLDKRGFGLDPVMQEIDAGTAFLVPVECSPACVYPGECQIAVVNSLSGPVVLSTRKAYDQHFDGVGDAGLLYIHRPEPNRIDGYRSNRVAVLSEGDEWEGIRHGGARDGVVKAIVDITDGREWPAMNARPGIDPGPFVGKVWHSPRHAMQGLNLWWTGRPGQEIAGIWFTHSVEGYTPRGPIDPGDNGLRWFLLQGRVRSDGVVKFSIERRCADGMEFAGDGVIRFDSEDRAVFRYWTEEYGRDQLELFALTTEHDGDLAGWYSTGDREGLHIARYWTPNGTVWVGYHYTDDGWTYMDGETPDNMTALTCRSRYKAVLPGSTAPAGSASFDGQTFELDGSRYTCERVL